MSGAGGPRRTHQLLLLLLILLLISPASANTLEEECAHCRFLVRSFKRGLEKTETLHFGGGNTDWEERNLKKFKHSEARLVEAMEYTCRKGDGDPDASKDLQFKCHSMAEENEETIEKWYFQQEDHPDLDLFLCVNELRKCCPDGHFGSACEPCPGYNAEAGSVCFDNGHCDGDGTRKGNGTCDCHSGYVGKACNHCEASYYPVSQNSTFIECAECFEGCAGGCEGPGPTGCRKCRTGYRMAEGAGVGCEDVDECAQADAGGETKCTGPNEQCINTAGAFRCDCQPGYTRNYATADGQCDLDIEATPPADGLWILPGTLLRVVAIVGLLGTSFFVLLVHRSPAALTLMVAALISAALIEYRYEGWLMEEGRKLFKESI